MQIIQVDIPIELLWEYREFKRDEVPAPRIPMISMYDVDAVTRYVKENGVEPLELSIIDRKALLTDGNHRIVAARRLGYKDVPVKVFLFKDDGRSTFYDHTINRFRPINVELQICLRRISEQLKAHLFTQ